MNTSMLHAISHIYLMTVVSYDWTQYFSISRNYKLVQSIISNLNTFLKKKNLYIWYNVFAENKDKYEIMTPCGVIVAKKIKSQYKNQLIQLENKAKFVSLNRYYKLVIYLQSSVRRQKIVRIVKQVFFVIHGIISKSSSLSVLEKIHDHQWCQRNLYKRFRKIKQILIELGFS